MELPGAHYDFDKRLNSYREAQRRVGDDRVPRGGALAKVGEDRARRELHRVRACGGELRQSPSS